MKPKIINRDYEADPHQKHRLLVLPSSSTYPWRVLAGSRSCSFPTHAEAIRYADEMVLRLREVS